MLVIKIPSSCYDSNQVTHSKFMCMNDELNKVCICVYVIQLELNCICMRESFWNQVRPAMVARLPLTMFVEINSSATLLGFVSEIALLSCQKDQLERHEYMNFFVYMAMWKLHCIYVQLHTIFKNLFFFFLPKITLIMLKRFNFKCQLS